MEVNNNLNKLKLLLQNVFEGKIVISENDTEKLLKYLDDSDENSPGKLILDTPCFSDLIYHSIVNLNSTSLEAKVFLIQIVTTLFKNELQFNKMQIQGFKESFCKFCILHNLKYNPPPNLHLAFINLATVHVTHFSGLGAIMEYEVWKKILQPKIHLKPRHISRAAYNFISKLVLKLDEYNLESVLIEVLGNILEPILTSEYLVLPAIDQETDDALCDKMFPHLSALVAIITETNNFVPDNKVISLLIDYFHVDHKLFSIYMITKNQGLLKLLNACVFRIMFASLRHLLFNKKTDEFCIKMAITHRNILVCAMNKRDAYTIIDYIVQSNIVWSSIENSQALEYEFPLAFERNGQKIELSLQIVIHLIVPIIKFAQMYQFSKNIQLMNEIEPFIVKISRTITDYIYSCCYVFASMLEEAGESFIRNVAIKTLKELLRLKEHLNESQAGVIFQSLYYVLSIFILCDEAGSLIVSENPMDLDDLRVLSHLLDAMKMLLKKYSISWYENVEIVNVQADLLTLLKQNFLTSKQVVQVLDLVDICVKKFLSPNMTLLIESNHRHDNTLNEVGEVIKLYAQHEEWEVRDSAFNLLKNCTEIALIKYVPLQKVIKDNNLISIAAKASFRDTDFYSQCTALRCLAEASKINSIWQEEMQANVDIYVQLVILLKDHPEGMVRKESAKVLTRIYENQKIDNNFQNTLYEVMKIAALDDLHWEVQLAALRFWKIAIHNHLTCRGMLDGKFPSVTFSKQKRKIIVLNKEEIKRQLAGVMDELSHIGCLTVLVECMNDINHLDVIIQALFIAKELIAILDRYQLEKVDFTRVEIEELPLQCEEDKNEPIDLTYYKTNKEERNKVIDSILSVDQAELITNIYNNFYQTKMYKMDIDDRRYPRRKFVKPDKFLEIYKNTDFSSFIDSKKHFYTDNSHTLSSLLDDILASEGIV